jgi:hypothetical protein
MRAVLREKRERARGLINGERGVRAWSGGLGRRSALSLSVGEVENGAAFTCPAWRPH